MSLDFFYHPDKEKSLSLCLRTKLVKILLGEIVLLSQVRSTALFLWKTAKVTYLILLNFSVFESTPPNEVHEEIKSSPFLFSVICRYFSAYTRTEKKKKLKKKYNAF